MPFRTETFHVTDVIEQIDQRQEQLADEATTSDLTEEEREEIVTEGLRLDAHLNGLSWVVEEYGEDVEITLGGLNKGEQSQIHDRAAAQAETVVGVGETGTDGAKSVYRTAMGLVDAPFLPDGAQDDFDARIAVVREDLPIELCRWVEDAVNDLTTVSEGNSPTFAERLAAKDGTE